VNRPLLRRLGAGIAKIKKAGKKMRVQHGCGPVRVNDYNNNLRLLARKLSLTYGAASF
jgi:hypothetical protein